jgi:hypothetical protein
MISCSWICVSKNRFLKEFYLDFFKTSPNSRTHKKEAQLFWPTANENGSPPDASSRLYPKATEIVKPDAGDWGQWIKVLAKNQFSDSSD